MKLRAKYLLIASLVIAAPFGLAHLWLIDRGVHFKGLQVDFGEPPARYALYYGTSMSDYPAWRPGTTYLPDDFSDPLNQEAERQETCQQARSAFPKAQRLEVQGRYRAALEVWSRYWKTRVGPPGVCRERIDLLRLLVDRPNLRLGRRLLLATQPIKPSVPLPAPEHVDAALRPFLLYKLANRTGNARDDARRYLAVAERYPRSAMAEPALIMVPRTLLDAENPNRTPADINLSRFAIDELARRYPHSRFRADVVGIRGRIDYLERRYVAALREYRRQMELCSAHVGLIGPLESIILCEEQLRRPARIAAAYLMRYGSGDAMLKLASIGHLGRVFDRFTASDGKAFRTLAEADPKLLCEYLDYRLSEKDHCSDLLPFATTKRVAALRSAYRSRFQALIAQAAYRCGKESLAARESRVALRSGAQGDDAALADFVLGAVEKRWGRTNEAIDRYESILKRHPKSYLCGGARENLALLFERQGRWADALDTYRELGYGYDVAYLLDIRMSPRQIADYISNHPRAKERNLLIFSLGLRYLRLHDWDRAEAVLARLSKRQRLAFVKPDEEYSFDATNEQDPLKTARELARLDAAVHRAKRGDREAKALLAVADYYYDHRDLMLYNPKLWTGDRSMAIGDSWNWHVATMQDDKALAKHHWEHECLAQSLLICRRILREFPRSTVRFQAAYRGACAAKHLSTFSPYWRWLNQVDHFDIEAIHLIRLARNSPDKRLAKRATKYAKVFYLDEHDPERYYDTAKHTTRWHSEYGAD